MFTAIVLACHIANADACIKLVDNRGPYKTEKRCEERIEEILASAIRIHVQDGSPFLPKEFVCRYTPSA